MAWTRFGSRTYGILPASATTYSPYPLLYGARSGIQATATTAEDHPRGVRGRLFWRIFLGPNP